MEAAETCTHAWCPKMGVCWFNMTRKGICPHTHIASELLMSGLCILAGWPWLSRWRGHVGRCVWADLNVRVLWTVRLWPDEAPADNHV
jgi:hypothetical protein